MDNIKKKFKLGNFISKALIFYAMLIIGSILIFMRFDYRGIPTFGQGKYNEESGAFSLAVDKNLDALGLCQPKKKEEQGVLFYCKTQLGIYGDNSLLIEKSIYNIDGNEELFAKYIELSIKYGAIASGEVPISIEGYKKSKKYYELHKSEHKPYLKLEILK